MSLAILYSRAQAGIHAPLVTVEVHLANGLPALSKVGYNNPIRNLLISWGSHADSIFLRSILNATTGNMGFLPETDQSRTGLHRKTPRT
ncbi:MAG: hypothetical protein ABW068_15990 [Candidatus Thiodiazotropha sp.]